MTDPLGGLSHAPPGPVPPQATAPPAPKAARPHTPTTFALLILFAAFFAAEALLGRDWSVESATALLRLGALYAPAVLDGDWWRLGSYAFLHIGWLHLLVNSWSLWVLAPQLEVMFGSNLTLGLFSGTALAAGAASCFWNLRHGHAPFAAGASGGIMGLFGATAALFWRLRRGLSPAARSRIVRAIGLNVLLMVVLSARAPVDNAAHIGGALAGIALGLIAPIRGEERQIWHRPAQWLIVLSAFALACSEGAAVAWAVHPRPRTLRAAGLEARVPGVFVPLESGLAGVPGEMAIALVRDKEPLQIAPGDDAVRLGDRTWVRERSKEKNDSEMTRLAASDGAGRIVIELWCGAESCRGPLGDRIYEQVAISLKTVP